VFPGRESYNPHRFRYFEIFERHNYIFMTEKIVGPIKISIGVRAALGGITLPRSGRRDSVARFTSTNSAFSRNQN